MNNLENRIKSYFIANSKKVDYNSNSNYLNRTNNNNMTIIVYRSKSNNVDL